jgi:hypothetical protein
MIFSAFLLGETSLKTALLQRGMGTLCVRQLYINRTDTQCPCTVRSRTLCNSVPQNPKPSNGLRTDCRCFATTCV